MTTIAHKDLVTNFTVTDSFLVNISASPQSGRIPLTVVLTGSSNVTVSSWIWTINGVVQPETTQQITRTFTQKGSYIVGLTATNIYSQTLTSYVAVTATTSLSVLDSALDVSDSDRIMGLVGSADIVHNKKGIGVKTPTYGQNFQNAGFTHDNGPSIICS
jgi:PKD repeat protein